MNSRSFRLLLLTLVTQSATCFAQELGSISGKIIESSTQKSVPFVNIFFANTLIGTTAKENGEYKIDKIPNGKYSLTISGLGYKLVSMPIEVTGAAIVLDIAIDQDIKLLNEVVVASRAKDFQINYLQFKKYFLGESSNASACEIVNEEAIDLQYDKDRDLLTAVAQEPIEIVNKALGYKLYYLLQRFSLDKRNQVVVVSGIPRFENLKSTKESQMKKWKRNRDRSYYGSINHFIRSWFAHTTSANHFIVWEVTSNEQERLLNPDTLFRKGLESIVEFKGTLKVVFDKEGEEFNYSKQQTNYFRPQSSYLKFTKPTMKIYRNGYYEDPYSLILNGYMGWEKIAELVPLEYEP